MADQITLLSGRDYDEAMVLLDVAFNHTQENRFARLLPGIYQPTDRAMACNYAVKREGRIAAIVGVFPITWHVGDLTLRVAGIGGVSVGDPHRRQGLMRRLMDRVRDDIERQGYHLSYLGGQRQRYRHWGWERAGAQMRLSMSPSSIRHEFGGLGETGISLEPITDDSGAAMFETLKALHDAQPAHCERPLNQFPLFLRHWLNEPMEARDRDGSVAGYLIFGHDRSIHEIVARDAAIAKRMVIAAARTECREGTLITLGLADVDLARWLGACGEGMELLVAGNWQVFDWVTVTDALVKLRHRAAPLALGRVVVRISDRDLNIRLSVDGQGAACTASDDEPDLALDAVSATRALFGPLPPSQVIALPGRATVLDAWCPLPMHLSVQDHV